MKILSFIMYLLTGNKVGDIAYEEALPFIVGNICHILPPNCWTQEEHQSLLYCYNKYKWSGTGWRFVERVELPRSEAVKIVRGKLLCKMPTNRVNGLRKPIE